MIINFVIFPLPALANLKAALVALTTVPPVMGGAHGMMMPGGCVVLVSNLNEHVRHTTHHTHTH